MGLEKPLITYWGNTSLVNDHIKEHISQELPQEGVEWQRTYGRASRTVFLEAQCVPLNDDHLKPDPNQKGSFLNKPLLHTFWTDVSDVDVYKTSLKDEITSWLFKLKESNISDWFVIHVDNSESRKANKATKLLPRSSVIDKIKSDFPSLKNSVERCISIIDPQRTDSKASESFQQFLNRLRSLLLVSYSRQLSKHEELVRSQRENRTAKDWDFFDFFFLQEELAFAFEMLSLYEDALVQYDELDALFSQFVINSNLGDMYPWLQKLSDNCDTWQGLCLSPGVVKLIRVELQQRKGTLLDLRCYLFSRQCELLLLLNKPWELASRSLPFLQNCVNELNILEITLVPGAIACWVFLSALEILQKCERYSDSFQMETFSLHTVGLWAYLRNKLDELGNLCGLIPGMKHTSECIHTVVNLIAGMGQDYVNEQVVQSPQTKLKEALSGQGAFLKHFLEISELTMGTYKHIGRMRCARLVGKDLALLYMQMNKPQQAQPFLLDLEKMYASEKWPKLLADIRSHLLKCYQALGDKKRELRLRCQLSASDVLSCEQRKEHFSQVLQLKDHSNSKNSHENIIIRMEDIFPIKEAILKHDREFIVTNSLVKVVMTLQNNFPEAVACEELAISLKYDSFNTNRKPLNRKICPHISLNNVTKQARTIEDVIINRTQTAPEIKTYHTAISVGVKCQNSNRILRRSDSHGLILLEKDPDEDTYEHAFVVRNVTLKPLINTLTLSFKTNMIGNFTLGQVCLLWKPNLKFIEPHVGSHKCFYVINEEPTLKVLQLTNLEGSTQDILAGIVHSVVLQLNSGSSHFEDNMSISLRASHGLKMKLETDMKRELSDEINLNISPALAPFETFTIPLAIKAKLTAQKDSSAVEHSISLTWTPNDSNSLKVISAHFHLLPPFLSFHKLHTCNQRKFVEISVHCLTNNQFSMRNPDLKLLENSDILIKPLLPTQKLDIRKEQSAHFMWELLQADASLNAGKTLFSIDYRLTNDALMDWQCYEHEFKLQNYQTFYAVRQSIEAVKGSEFCRVGTLCNLIVGITKLFPANDHNSIMYEIIADQNMWSLNGKIAGVVSIENVHEVSFEVIPLISGYLPLPTIRLSKYVASNTNESTTNEAKLIAFDVGQVYNWNRASQVHILPSSGLIVSES